VESIGVPKGTKSSPRVLHLGVSIPVRQLGCRTLMENLGGVFLISLDKLCEVEEDIEECVGLLAPAKQGKRFGV